MEGVDLDKGKHGESCGKQSSKTQKCCWGSLRTGPGAENKAVGESGGQGVKTHSAQGAFCEAALPPWPASRLADLEDTCSPSTPVLTCHGTLPQVGALCPQTNLLFVLYSDEKHNASKKLP